MKKSTTVGLIVVLITSIVIYSQLSKTEVTSYTITLDRGTYTSSDNKHEVIMRFCLPEINSSSGWVEGTLMKNGNSSKVIYWNKVETLSNEWINVEWIDINTVKINDIEFDVSKFPNINVYNHYKK